jgi:hypothetical protein
MPVFSYDHPRGHTREGAYNLAGYPGTIEIMTEFGKRAARFRKHRPKF